MKNYPYNLIIADLDPRHNK